MAEYRLTWEIDIEASNPHEAAIEARKVQVELADKVTVFLVRKRLDLGGDHPAYGEPTLTTLTAND